MATKTVLVNWKATITSNLRVIREFIDEFEILEGKVDLHKQFSTNEKKLEAITLYQALADNNTEYIQGFISEFQEKLLSDSELTKKEVNNITKTLVEHAKTKNVDYIRDVLSQIVKQLKEFSDMLKKHLSGSSDAPKDIVPIQLGSGGGDSTPQPTNVATNADFQNTKNSDPPASVHPTPNELSFSQFQPLGMISPPNFQRTINVNPSSSTQVGQMGMNFSPFHPTNVFPPPGFLNRPLFDSAGSSGQKTIQKFTGINPFTLNNPSSIYTGSKIVNSTTVPGSESRKPESTTAQEADPNNIERTAIISRAGPRTGKPTNEVKDTPRYEDDELTESIQSRRSPRAPGSKQFSDFLDPTPVSLRHQPKVHPIREQTTWDGESEPSHYAFQSEPRRNVDSRETFDPKPQPVQFSGANDIRFALPPIVIPNFDGNEDDYLTFRQSFMAFIDSDMRIPPITKLLYLKNYCIGQARELIAPIPYTDESYPEAWRMLNNRYAIGSDGPTRLWNRLRILEAQSPSGGHLCELLDKIKIVVSQLKYLNEQIDNIPFMSTILEKFPENVQSQIRRMKTRWDNPWKTSEMIRALEDILVERERNERMERFAVVTKYKFVDSIQINSTSVATSVPPTSEIVSSQPTSEDEDSVDTYQKCCYFCYNPNHMLYDCPQSVAQKKQILKDRRLCENCFGPNHTTAECRAEKCRACQENHHESLCFEAIQIHRSPATSSSASSFSDNTETQFFRFQ